MLQPIADPATRERRALVRWYLVMRATGQGSPASRRARRQFFQAKAHNDARLRRLADAQN